VIRIHKGDAPPGFIHAGDEHRQELCAAYDADTEAYCSGGQKMVFRETIYQSVTAELDACHHGKCCYCEAPLDANKEVEHWRPKSRYYWLAYSWDNLLLSRSFCNKKKFNQFPLEDEAKRALNHRMRLDDETPTILKPDGDADPRSHIEFHGDRPEGLPSSSLGPKTIEVLGLDSPKHTGRQRHLRKLELERAAYVLNFRSTDPEYRRRAEVARSFIEEAARPKMPYSAMASAYLKANPLPKPPEEPVACTD
jgi:uncharacterized protein (TIGR02646 family)